MRLPQILKNDKRLYTLYKISSLLVFPVKDTVARKSGIVKSISREQPKTGIAPTGKLSSLRSKCRASFAGKRFMRGCTPDYR